MSIKKSHLTTKKAVAGALVALSGFVPQPLINSAHAATATISVSGSFITGIQLVAGVDANFGSVAVTQPNGSVKLSTAGAVTSTKAVAVAGAVVGTFSFKAVSTVPNVDITLDGMGAVTLAATGGGAGPVGTAKLAKIIVGGIGAASTIADGGAGTGKKAGYNITAKTAKLKIGGFMSWGATQPIGAFATPLEVTVAF